MDFNPGDIAVTQNSVWTENNGKTSWCSRYVTTRATTDGQNYEAPIITTTSPHC